MCVCASGQIRISFLLLRLIFGLMSFRFVILKMIVVRRRPYSYVSHVS